jgi:hypothetical protein
MAGERPAGDGRIIDPSAFESAFAPGPAPRIQTAAFVTRVEQALSETGQANLVGYSRTVLPAGSSVVLTPGGLQISFAPGATPSPGLRTLVRWSYQGTDKSLPLRRRDAWPSAKGPPPRAAARRKP